MGPAAVDNFRSLGHNFPNSPVPRRIYTVQSTIGPVPSGSCEAHRYVHESISVGIPLPEEEFLRMTTVESTGEKEYGVMGKGFDRFWKIHFLVRIEHCLCVGTNSRDFLMLN